MVVVLTIVCIGLAVKVNRANSQKAAFNSLRRFPGIISYDYQCTQSQIEPPGPAWLRDMVGVDYFADIQRVCLDGGKDLKETEMAQIGTLTHLKSLRISGPGVTDSGIAHLKNLRQLEDLALVGKGVTDAGLAHLENLSNLRRLVLSKTQVTRAGVEELRRKLPDCEIVKSPQS